MLQVHYARDAWRTNGLRTDSSHRSEQLSCIKFFHLSYGLIVMIFPNLNDFLNSF